MNIKLYIKRIQNVILRAFFYTKSINSQEKTVYLTFDDGPETGITEFVLGELEKYGFKGTFFCRGDNASKNNDLVYLIKEGGHSIGNHTFSHIHAFCDNARHYAEDIGKADSILHTHLFRPPHGSLTFASWYRIKNKYRIIYWSLNSGDSDIEDFDFNRSFEYLKNNTQSGSIILFHFCHRHEKETRQLLPKYLKWLNDYGYIGKAIL